jgi:hypothetical protein
MTNARATRGPWTALKLPAALTRIKAMLSDEEKQYLTWLTAEKFEGWGAVVDLGPWLGSSSAALAEGLRRQNSTARVQSYDLFKWDREYMSAIAAEDLAPGDDFRPLFLREVGEYASMIDAHKEDVSRLRWSGGPIEILFVDVAKTWDLTNAVFRGFGHALVPGKSRVVLQDFRHHSTHWLPLVFDSRPDLWTEAEAVEEGWTVTFIPNKKLDGPDGITSEPSEESFSFETAETLMRARMARESDRNGGLLLRSLYRKALLDGDPSVCDRLRRELLENEPEDALGEIEDIEPLLLQQGWRAYNREDYRTARLVGERCMRGKETPSVYALGLYAMSSLNLGDKALAATYIDQIVRGWPDFLPGLLYRAELAVADHRLADARTDATNVLERSGDDQDVRNHALHVLKWIEGLE